MSLGLQTSSHGSKRLLEEDDRVPFTEYNPQKRLRHIASPSGRCGSGQFSSPLAYTVGSNTLSALRALFPFMDDKVIADVLAEYGDNIDAAIKHLNELQLTQPPNDTAPGQQTANSNDRDGSAAGPSSSHAADAAREPAAQPSLANAQSTGGGAGGAETQHQNQQQQQQQEPQQSQQPTGDQWIDTLVSQMSAAADVPDAKRRAAEVLQAFEQAVVQRTRSQEPRNAELERENAVLKRAVAIQNARLQELATRESEALQLRGALEGAKARLQALEVQNYSLQLHLKAATDARDAALGGGAPRNPDIF